METIKVAGLVWTVAIRDIYCTYRSGNNVVSTTLNQGVRVNNQPFGWYMDGLEELEYAPKEVQELFIRVLNGEKVRFTVGEDGRVLVHMPWQDQVACEDLTLEDLRILGVVRIRTQRGRRYHCGCSNVYTDNSYAYSAELAGTEIEACKVSYSEEECIRCIVGEEDMYRYQHDADYI